MTPKSRAFVIASKALSSSLYAKKRLPEPNARTETFLAGLAEHAHRHPGALILRLCGLPATVRAADVARKFLASTPSIAIS